MANPSPTSRPNHWDYEVKGQVFDLCFCDGPLPLWWVGRKDRTGFAAPADTMDEAIDKAHQMADGTYPQSST